MNFVINGRNIGSNSPSFIVAEMSGNHGGDINRAKSIIRLAKEAGADAVKLQTYKGDTITLNSDKEDFRLPPESPWAKSKTLYDLYQEAHTPWEWHEELFAFARSLNLTIFSAPFDESAVDLLEGLKCPMYKIASPEITHIPLIRRVAQSGKPVILSTGVADKDDLDLAVEALRKYGCRHISILKCTTSYPAPPEDANLLAIPLLQSTYNCVPGLSDHSIGDHGAIAAVALGARIIEKHFVDDKSQETVDSFFSADFNEFRSFVQKIRDVEKMLGSPTFAISPSARTNLRGRRSLYIAKSVKAGEVLTVENVRCVRPSFGLHPKYFEQVLNRRLKNDKDAGDRLSLTDLES
jgi:pseudaminic acid synthase